MRFPVDKAIVGSFDFGNFSTPSGTTLVAPDRIVALRNKVVNFDMGKDTVGACFNIRDAQGRGVPATLRFLLSDRSKELTYYHDGKTPFVGVTIVPAQKRDILYIQITTNSSVMWITDIYTAQIPEVSADQPRPAVVHLTEEDFPTDHKQPIVQKKQPASVVVHQPKSAAAAPVAPPSKPAAVAQQPMPAAPLSPTSATLPWKAAAATPPKLNPSAAAEDPLSTD